jgi:hypothetical protein
VRGFDNRQDGGEHIEILQISKISQRCQEPVTPIAYCAPNFNANTSFASYPVVQRTTNGPMNGGSWRKLVVQIGNVNGRIPPRLCKKRRCVIGGWLAGWRFSIVGFRRTC